MVGVDGTPTSLGAPAYAVGLARRQRAELIVVYVRSPLRTPAALSGWVDAGIVAAEVQAQHDAEDDIWAQIADDAKAWGTGARIVARDGNPLHELRKVAEESGADTIIVGASAGPPAPAVRLARAPPTAPQASPGYDRPLNRLHQACHLRPGGPGAAGGGPTNAGPFSHGGLLRRRPWCWMRLPLSHFPRHNRRPGRGPRAYGERFQSYSLRMLP